MLKIIPATLLSAALFVSAAAWAATPAAQPECTDASMSDMHSKVDAITDAKMKKSAEKEAALADKMMKAHKMKSCSLHMGKAMKNAQAM
jgi:hypothetical protein